MNELIARINDLKRIRMLLVFTGSGSPESIRTVSGWIDEHQRELDAMAAECAA